MKKLLTILTVSTLMSSAFAAEFRADPQTPTTSTTVTTTTVEETTTKLAPTSTTVTTTTTTEPAGFTESVKVYWNKFLDVLTGPTDNK